MNEHGPQTGDWLVDTVKRNPEAFLVLAAGCALLMRSKATREAPRHEGQYYRDAEAPRRQAERVGESVAQTTEAARDYASDVTNRVTDTARDYAADISDKVTDAATRASDYAGGVRDAVSSGLSNFPGQARATVESGFARVLREQPLAIAAMGLAAGATLAAIFPSTEAEGRALGPAHDAVLDAASRTADNVKAAAGEAGEQLKQAARDRGLHPEGLKDLARDVAGTFADNVAGRQTGQAEPHRTAPGLVPEHTGSET